jgi:hypothetical protein
VPEFSRGGDALTWNLQVREWPEKSVGLIDFYFRIKPREQLPQTKPWWNIYVQQFLIIFLWFIILFLFRYS